MSRLETVQRRPLEMATRGNRGYWAPHKKRLQQALRCNSGASAYTVTLGTIDRKVKRNCYKPSRFDSCHATKSAKTGDFCDNPDAGEQGEQYPPRRPPGKENAMAIGDVIRILAEGPTLEECYESGFDWAVRGANEVNCHVSLFRSKDHTKQWERGKAAGGKFKIKQAQKSSATSSSSGLSKPKRREQD